METWEKLLLSIDSTLGLWKCNKILLAGNCVDKLIERGKLFSSDFPLSKDLINNS